MSIGVPEHQTPNVGDLLEQVVESASQRYAEELMDVYESVEHVYLAAITATKSGGLAASTNAVPQP
jgi:hypothetical protein